MKNIKAIIIVVLLFILLNFLFFVKNINHHCSNEKDCPICNVMRTVRNNFKAFIPNIVGGIKIFFSFYIQFYLFKTIFIIKNKTLIELKVRLNN